MLSKCYQKRFFLLLVILLRSITSQWRKEAFSTRQWKLMMKCKNKIINFFTSNIKVMGLLCYGNAAGVIVSTPFERPSYNCDLCKGYEQERCPKYWRCPNRMSPCPRLGIYRVLRVPLLLTPFSLYLFILLALLSTFILTQALLSLQAL